MKKILIIALMGLGLTMPFTNTSAASFKAKRIITVNITTVEITANSEVEDGTITKVEIRKQGNSTPEISQSCGGYSCNVNVTSLKTGNYQVKVICANTVYTQWFTR